MSFSLGNSLIGIKLREEMYLKHLKEVQKINNREFDNKIKVFRQHRSISQLHKNNKLYANNLKVKEEKRRIQEKNKEMQKKILSIQSSHDIKQNRSRYWENSESLQKTDIHHLKRKSNFSNIQLRKAAQRQKYRLLPQLNKEGEGQREEIRQLDN